MLFVGIDMGSSCTKTVVMDQQRLFCHKAVCPTGWNSIATAAAIKQELDQLYPGEKLSIIATGYGRSAIAYANKTVTEITCHGQGAAFLFGSQPALVIDIGGQDSKIISIANGRVTDFVMNDKCSAGTGRFLEIMAATLGVSIDSLCTLAKDGRGLAISSMCTVFAESEVISLIGKGAVKEDIAFGIIESITNKIVQQASRIYQEGQSIYLTGGLCDLAHIISVLSAKLGQTVITHPDSRYAGAIGAALLAQKL